MHVEILKAGLVDVDLTLPIQVGIFLVFYFLLRFALFGPILKILLEREERVATASHEAEKLENSTAARVALYESRMKEARGQAIRERDALRADGARVEREVVAKVRAEVDAKVGEVRAALARTVVEARSALATEQGPLAERVVEALLGRKVGRN